MYTKTIKFIENKVKVEGIEIKVHSGKCRLNLKCHKNSVHEAVKAGDKSIALVMCLSKDYEPFIHFLNIRKGRYIDNTLGVWHLKYSMYLMKEVPKKDFFNVDSIFTNYSNYLVSSIPLYLRLFNKPIF